jgi:hypothetical protein
VKMALSFVSGLLVFGLVLFGVKSAIPIRAETDNLSAPSENLTQSMTELLPDIEKIYRESLITPFQKAESEIYDEDIGLYYQDLLDNSVFYEPEDVEY